MLTLLRDLRRLRRQINLPAPSRGRSLAVRHLDAGSCNGCEHELVLATSPYYDLQRFGLGVVASPRHADLLLVTGTVTTRMHTPLLTAYAAMPEPRRVAALGNCALGCNLLGNPADLVGPVESVLPVDLRIPGCPPTPGTIAEALLQLIDNGPNRPDAESTERPDCASRWWASPPRFSASLIAVPPSPRSRRSFGMSPSPVTIIDDEVYGSAGLGVYRGETQPNHGDLIEIELDGETLNVQVEAVHPDGSMSASRRP